MKYESNLKHRGVEAEFPFLRSRVMGHSFGHDVPSDWSDFKENDPRFGIYTRCGMWTHDEAALLYAIAAAQGGMRWADIGAHTGWTAWHIGSGLVSAAGGKSSPLVDCVDPALADAEFNRRFRLNTTRLANSVNLAVWDVPSVRYWRDMQNEGTPIDGACIDGDHEPGEPLKDARAAVRCGAKVIVFHDFTGQPTREAVAYCTANGYRQRVYLTPHVVAVAWRDPHFVPPVHEPDPALLEQRLERRMQDFNFGAGGWWGE